MQLDDLGSAFDKIRNGLMQRMQEEQEKKPDWELAADAN